MLKIACSLLSLSLAFALAACGSGEEAEVGQLKTPEPPPAKPWERRIDPRLAAAAVENKPAPDFTAEILAVGSEYKKYTRRGEHARWVTGMCSAPMVGPMFSANREETAHGKKLYYLFVKDNSAYEALGVIAKPPQAGQALVKESYRPVEVASGRGWATDTDGRSYIMGEMYALFVMLRLDSKTPGTDDGWVYGTLTPDAKKVTSQGRVESCMGCHEDAPYERLYGPTKSAPASD